MVRKLSIKKQFLEITFLFLLVAGIALTLMGVKIRQAQACGSAVCFPPVTCVFGECNPQRVEYGGNCNTCQCPPCECVWELGRCTTPYQGTNPPVYPECGCNACASSPCSGGGGGGANCSLINCNGVMLDDPDFQACCVCPVIIDVSGNGYNLTSAPGGVNFDLNCDGAAEHLSWTSTNSDDAFLVLDRNTNGSIEDGSELFGNFTPQSSRVGRNGFLALAEYDKLENGGIEDGRINRQDAIFSSLRLWQDLNHNGISEPSELHPLRELGVYSIDLDYKESKRTDQYGNRFRYRAKVRDSHDAQVGRWAWDVFFVSQN